MKQTFIKLLTIVLTILANPFASKAQSSVNPIHVNLILKMDDGKIGRQYFTDFVEQDETQKDETPAMALERINKELTFKIRAGLHEKSNDIRYGNFPDALYTLKVRYIKSNEDGQHGQFQFELNSQDNQTLATFIKKDKGGTIGSRLNLLGDCLFEVGKKSAKQIETIIKTKHQ